MSLSVVPGSSKLRIFGVDAVSAATGTTEVVSTSTTAKPVSSAISTSISRLLSDGSMGEDVKLLQTWLNNNGANLKVDGIFGKLTLAAVKNYQCKNGLVVDGIVGPKTIAKLTPVVVTPTTPAAPTTPPVTTPVDTVTSASIVNNADAFKKAISKDGKWIICTLNDLTFNERWC